MSRRELQKHAAEWLRKAAVLARAHAAASREKRACAGPVIDLSQLRKLVRP